MFYKINKFNLIIKTMKKIKLTFLMTLLILTSTVFAQKDKPNILVIFGDDVGITNISAYSHGLMGYQTPNIDRVAKEGVKFTDYYAEQSCTAGRASFITGQIPFRVGLSKVGMPGAKSGISDKDPCSSRLTMCRRFSEVSATKMPSTAQPHSRITTSKGRNCAIAPAKMTVAKA